jgi:hypothetical protein
MVAHSEGRGKTVGSPRPAWTKVVATPCFRNKIKNKKSWCIAQVVEQLPNICKDLGSIPSTTEKRKRKDCITLITLT